MSVLKAKAFINAFLSVLDPFVGPIRPGVFQDYTSGAGLMLWRYLNPLFSNELLWSNKFYFNESIGISIPLIF